MNNRLPSTKILGTNITTAPKDKILEFILENMEGSNKKVSIVTPNPEILVYAFERPEFQEVLNRAEISLPDGVGVTISSRVLKNQPLERITGVDMMELLCRESAKRALTVGFLGGRGDVAERTAICLVKKYPDLIVKFANSDWNEEKIANDGLQLTTDGLEIKKITNGQKSEAKSQKSSHIDILFVAMGFPKQEIWIDQNLQKIPVKVAMGVGGSFDYLSGDVKRAPKAIRKIGMEWAFRLARQPWRIKRQTALPKFVYQVLKEKIKSSS